MLHFLSNLFLTGYYTIGWGSYDLCTLLQNPISGLFKFKCIGMIQLSIGTHCVTALEEAM